MWTQTVARLFALSLSGGILCGMLWDVFKIPRIVCGIPESKTDNMLYTFVVFLQDLFFCLLCGIVTILVLYYGNEGNIRGIAFVGMSVSFAAYRVTFGTLAEKCVKKLCVLASKICSKIFCLCKKIASLLKKRKVEIKEE